MTTKTQPGKLKNRRDFLRVQRGGLRSKGHFVSLISRARHESVAGRFGLVTPKAIGKAHDRNKIKRRLRHIVSLFPEIVGEKDVVLLAFAQCKEVSFEDLKTDLLNTAERHKRIVQSRKRYSNYKRANARASR